MSTQYLDAETTLGRYRNTIINSLYIVLAFRLASAPARVGVDIFVAIEALDGDSMVY